MDRWLRLAPVVGAIMVIGGLTLMILHLRLDLPGYGVHPAEPLCVVLGLALFLSLFARGMQRNAGAYAAHALTMIFFALLLMTLFEIAQNHSPRWDLTRAKANSLSPQAARFLHELENPVHLTVFVPSPEKREADEFMRKFSAETPLLTYDITDPVIDRAATQHVTDDPNVQVNYEETYAIVYDPETADRPRMQREILRKAKAVELTQEALINAVAQALNERKRTLYYLVGHGEPSLDPVEGENARSVSTLRGELQERGFELKPLNAAQTGVVPEDCETLLCIAPRADLAPMERTILQDWLDEGGKAIIMLNPLLSKTGRLDQFGELLMRYGVRAHVDQIALDLQMGNRDANYAMFPIHSINESPLTRGIKQNFNMAWAMPLAPGPTAADYHFEDLIFTSEQTFSVPVPVWFTGKIEPPKTREGYFRHTLAATVSKETGAGHGVKLLVIGDGECVLDGARIGQPQLALIFNALNWMLAGGRQIAIPPVKVANTPANFTPLQLRVVLLVCLVLLPCSLLFGGYGLAMLRRRMR
ncbi:GldG family protein [Candidatus Sumerlaeota bacterium]|nr:GldG family protein [Candidatus Sumerlaeota bacterium]